MSHGERRPSTPTMTTDEGQRQADHQQELPVGHALDDAL